MDEFRFHPSIPRLLVFVPFVFSRIPTLRRPGDVQHEIHGFFSFHTRHLPMEEDGIETHTLSLCSRRISKRKDRMGSNEDVSNDDPCRCGLDGSGVSDVATFLCHVERCRSWEWNDLWYDLEWTFGWTKQRPGSFFLVRNGMEIP